MSGVLFSRLQLEKVLTDTGLEVEFRAHCGLSAKDDHVVCSFSFRPATKMSDQAVKDLSLRIYNRRTEKAVVFVDGISDLSAVAQTISATRKVVAGG